MLLRHWLAFLRPRRSPNQSLRARVRRRHSRHSETLEDRTLLAATISLAGGVLTYTGDGAVNSVEMRVLGERYTFDSSTDIITVVADDSGSAAGSGTGSVTIGLAADDIRSIVINTLADNDFIRVHSTNDPVTINAGANDDDVLLADTFSTVDDVIADVTVNGDGGTDALDVIDFDTALVNPLITLTELTLSGVAPGLITYGTVEDLFIDTADALATSVDVLGTAANTQTTFELTFAGATAFVDVGLGDLSSVMGDLHLNFNDGDGFLFVDDFLSTTADTASISVDGFGTTEIAGFSPGLMSYEGTSVVSLDVLAGEGNDVITISGANASNLSVNSGLGDDRIDGSAATQSLRLNGGNGNDTIIGGAGDDTLNGGNGDDLIQGGAGLDQLFGDGFQAQIAGNDTLIGDTGNDLIYGDSGGSTIPGVGGDDLLIWNNGDGSDRMDGEGGLDTVQVNGANAAGDNFLVAPDAVPLSTRLSFSRTNLGLFNLDIGTVENLEVNGQGGEDTVTIEDLTGVADLMGITINGGDAFDVVTLNGSDLDADDFFVERNADRVDVVWTNLRTLLLDIGTAETLNINGQGNNDLLTVNHAPGLLPLTVNYDGGANGIGLGDALFLENGTFNTVTYRYDNATDGAVTLDDGTAMSVITYTGLEPISNSGTAQDALFFLPDLPLIPNADTVLQNDIFPGWMELTGSTFEDTLFTNPTRSLTIIAGNQGDTITLASLDPAFGGLITVNGGIGADIVDAAAIGLGVIINGSDGNDMLFGGMGNDTIDGGGGDDLIFGGAGNDDLLGAEDNDQVFGDDGNDTIRDDFDFPLETLTTNDVLFGGRGDDWIAGGVGFDQLFGDEGNDTILGGTGDDILWGGLGNDDLTGEEDNDQVFGEDGNDIIRDDFDSPSESLTANDTLIGGMGDDQIAGGVGADEIEGNDGNDLIQGGDGNDLLTGGLGIDTINGDAGDDQILGESDNDLLRGGTGSDSLFGGDGDDTALGGAGDDRIEGEAGNDRLAGEAGFDTIFGGLGIDGITGGLDDDVLFGGDDRDYISGQEGDDNINGEAGNDRLNGNAGVDVIFGGLGDDFISGGTENDTLNGAAGNDTLQGDAGNDTLRGGDDNDALNGGIGNDMLLGGMGNDLLEGEDGNDQLAGEAGLDTILGGAGIDDIAGGMDNDMLLGGDDRDYISGQGGDDTIDGEDGDDRLFGNDGNDLILGGVGADLGVGGIGNDTLNGNQGPDTLLGEDGDDLIRGGSENDQIAGGIGADRVLGGSGDDVIAGDDGNDSLAGEAGADTIRGGSGIDSISGGDDADTLEGGDDLDYISGQGGNDTITGDAGADRIRGNDGDDLLIWNIGDGSDLNDGGTGEDTLDLNGSNAADNVNVIDSGTGFQVGIATAQIANDQVDRLDIETFAGNDVVDATGLSANMLIQKNRLAGIDAGLLINAGLGNDTILGSQGTDEIHGGDGADEIIGHAGDDCIFGDAGDDTIHGDTSATNGIFGQNHSIGDDVIFAGDGNDTVNGGLGADTIGGGNGQDLLYGSRSSDFFHPNAPITERPPFYSDLTLTSVDLAKRALFQQLANADQDLLFGGAWFPIGMPNFANLPTLANFMDQFTEADANNAQDTLIGNLGQDGFDGGTGADQINAVAGDNDIIRSTADDTVEFDEPFDII